MCRYRPIPSFIIRAYSFVIAIAFFSAADRIPVIVRDEQRAMLSQGDGGSRGINRLTCSHDPVSLKRYDGADAVLKIFSDAFFPANLF